MRRPRPTANILSFARSQPGGVIRWCEAAAKYREVTGISRRTTHYHMNVGHILRDFFVRVEGVRGYYVLKETIRRERNSLCEVCGLELNDDDSCPNFLPLH